jgi:hypothetical protein
MHRRTSAALLMVASLVLLALTGVAWASSGERGVGLQLPDDGTAASRVTPLDQLPSPRRADGEGAAAPSALPVPAEIPLRDATRIEPLEQRDPPLRLRIASVDVDMPIASAGVLPDGQMDLPEDPRKIGWYRFGPGPGEERGSVVLGGHVDSNRYGVGPLARLAAVEVGARIVVTDAAGAPVRYRVTSVERISKAALPTQRLFDRDSAPRLVVITCGGRYLPEAGGYEDNIVVLARPA